MLSLTFVPLVKLHAIPVLGEVKIFWVVNGSLIIVRRRFALSLDRVILRQARHLREHNITVLTCLATGCPGAI